MLERFWAKARIACLLILAIVVIGIVVSPWLLLAGVLPIGLVLLKGKPAKDQPLTITEESETESELLKEWRDQKNCDLICKLSNVGINEFVINYFSGSPLWEIRQAVAASPSVNQKTLEKLV